MLGEKLVEQLRKGLKMTLMRGGREAGWKGRRGSGGGEGGGQRRMWGNWEKDEEMLRLSWGKVEAKLEEQLEDQAGGVGGGKVSRGFLVMKKNPVNLKLL